MYHSICGCARKQPLHLHIIKRGVELSCQEPCRRMRPCEGDFPHWHSGGARCVLHGLPQRPARTGDVRYEEDADSDGCGGAAELRRLWVLRVGLRSAGAGALWGLAVPRVMRRVPVRRERCARDRHPQRRVLCRPSRRLTRIQRQPQAHDLGTVPLWTGSQNRVDRLG